jgi:hypothetical protein
MQASLGALVPISEMVRHGYAGRLNTLYRAAERGQLETDSRFADYRRKFGEASWELDALTPTYLVELVRSHTERWIEKPAHWQRRHAKIARERAKLATVAESWA